MTGCPCCATYLCAGHAPPRDCLHGEAEISWRHVSDDHRFCQPGSGCAWADTTRPLVLAAGLRGTADQPLVLVLVSPATGRVLFAGQAFRDHREAKTARTRAGGQGWAAKSRAFLMCARRSLH
jgi:hypothetical protein